MKKNIIIIAAIFILPMLAYMGLTRNNCCTAKQLETGKPQVIKFASAMCIDCQTMSKVFKEIMPQFKDKVTFTEINVQNMDANTGNLIKKYNITLVPTVVLLDSQGRQVKRLEGAIPVNEMTNYIKGLK